MSGKTILTLLAATLPFCATSAFAAPARKPAAKKSTAKPTAKKPPAPVDPLVAALAKSTGLDVAPASAALDGPGAHQRLLVTATMADGSGYDVTDRVTFVTSQPKIVKIASGVVTGLGDGTVRIRAKLGKLQSDLSDFTITNSQAPKSIQFVNDIMPIFSKSGCNSTACHGSPVGKGGFKLSLFGYEPELDFSAMTKEVEGKSRINAKDPVQSLVLQKATMGAPHAGGLRFKKDSSEYRTLLDWIRLGSPGMSEFEARVKSVGVIPDQPWIPSPNLKQRLAVTAYMSDGTTRDVTDQALFSSNDDAIASVDEGGVVSAKRPGETAVMVRYMGQVGISRIAVLPDWKAPDTSKLTRNNYIDERVQSKLQKLRMLPSDVCSDEEFIRRATLDTCGLIPTVDEVKAFAADTSSNKRSKLIDKLLDRPEFVDLWTLKWNDTLRNNPRLTRRGLLDYHSWIRKQIETNRPYNEWVKELVTATGRNVTAASTIETLPRQIQESPRAQQIINQLNAAQPNAAANYYVVSRDPLDVTSATSQVFMGVRIECARCHNHPFEKWTQDDYYALAAFFSGLQVRGQQQVASVVGFNARANGIRHPKTNETVEPKTLDNAEVKVQPRTDGRQVFADWMTSEKNPYFSKAIANRIWGHYFGRGIVDPVDDFRVTNPASNPELLDALARDLVEYKFDLKHLHRSILNSRTYQQSSRPNHTNRTDNQNFARYYPKRMFAEQLYDSISQATDIFLNVGGRRQRPGQRYPNPLGEQPIQRATQIPAVPQAQRGPGQTLSSFLDTFGRPRREVVCECERSAEGNMGQALALINGEEVNFKIASPFGRVQKLVRQNTPDKDAIEELYLATLSRRPTTEELNDAAGLLNSSKVKKEGIEDLMWALLNSREFLFVH